VRPIDPISLIPAAFAFVTYHQTICALRALNLLPQITLEPSEDSESSACKLTVKAGSKETYSLSSVNKTEQEAALTLPEGSSLEDVYGPIRYAIERILHPAPLLEIPSVGDVNNAKSNDVATSTMISSSDATAATSIATSSTPATTIDTANPANIDEEGKPVNYYSFISLKETGIGDERQTVTDESGEKFLNAEIEKFRMRQQQRDK